MLPAFPAVGRTGGPEGAPWPAGAFQVLLPKEVQGVLFQVCTQFLFME